MTDVTNMLSLRMNYSDDNVSLMCLRIKESKPKVATNTGGVQIKWAM